MSKTNCNKVKSISVKHKSLLCTSKKNKNNIIRKKLKKSTSPRSRNDVNISEIEQFKKDVIGAVDCDTKFNKSKRRKYPDRDQNALQYDGSIFVSSSVSRKSVAERKRESESGFHTYRPITTCKIENYNMPFSNCENVSLGVKEQKSSLSTSNVLSKAGYSEEIINNFRENVTSVCKSPVDRDIVSEELIVMNGHSRNISNECRRKHSNSLDHIGSAWSMIFDHCEDFENGEFLKTIDRIVAHKPSNWFELYPCTKDEKRCIQKKIVIKNIIQESPRSVCADLMKCTDKLIYKMSAPYRNMKFFRYSRQVFKHVKKINAVNCIEPLLMLSEKFSNSKGSYDTTEEAIVYIATLFLSKIIRMNRLLGYCRKAALHCVSFINHKLLVIPNLLFLACTAEIYNEMRKYTSLFVDHYESLAAFATNRIPLPKIMKSALRIESTPHQTEFTTLPQPCFKIGALIGLNENQLSLSLISNLTSSDFL